MLTVLYIETLFDINMYLLYCLLKIKGLWAEPTI